jgi:hypothetical protein
MLSCKEIRIEDIYWKRLLDSPTFCLLFLNHHLDLLQEADNGVPILFNMKPLDGSDGNDWLPFLRKLPITHLDQTHDGKRYVTLLRRFPKIYFMISHYDGLYTSKEIVSMFRNRWIRGVFEDGFTEDEIIYFLNRLVDLKFEFSREVVWVGNLLYQMEHQKYLTALGRLLIIVEKKQYFIDSWNKQKREKQKLFE